VASLALQNSLLQTLDFGSAVLKAENFSPRARRCLQERTSICTRFALSSMLQAVIKLIRISFKVNEHGGICLEHFWRVFS
jgi:hypothetical protein